MQIRDFKLCFRRKKLLKTVFVKVKLRTKLSPIEREKFWKVYIS
ncbi:MAG: hypothetical protein ACTS4U_00545 [Candidatus Hodgkinia cicadicola]